MLIAKPRSTDLANAAPTEEPLPVIGAEEIEPRFRAVVGRGGERRGIRLERIYWDGLGRMSSAGKMTTSDLVHYTASQMPESGNLASLLRVLSLKWALRRLDAVEDVASMANLNAVIQASPSPTILLTQDKKIHLFNDPFLSMLRQRLPLGDTAQLTRSLRFSIDTQIEQAITTLNLNRGKTLNTGFSIGVGTQSMRGQVNLALAPTHEKSMLIGYISRY
ncbi:aryl-sulfate sulfotransferase [Rhizobium sp. SEMIA 4085]|uniref:Ribbon-helix-helix domain-containing protein n=1 Tax=Rhizobium gallicum bv. gallicum R602sp TaxID=1041138 RepID=A0A0B4X1R4_9HYPH|nr:MULTISPECIES: ribbon-helix-helix domain-containing protein [Rhizobium]AJD40463.1 ribbon-helix-helix domain-containing protein [Rhizobium gallicum bv. gallicum R602sp]NNH30164.1 aryl-sulfate sulfotransferase [Rhizobium sp. SEMIA 4085]